MNLQALAAARRAPDVKALAPGVYRELKAQPASVRNRFCTELWQSGRWQEWGLACYVYRRFARSCGAAEFRLFERWLDGYVNTWANCDGLSAWLFAAALENQPKLIDELPAWTRSKNRWRRRAAAVSLLREAAAGRNLAVIFDIADRLAEDRDDLVEKGVGWLLKVAYPPQPEAVVEFVLQNRRRFSRTTLRYAAEKMTPADRAKVLDQAPR